MRHKIIMTAATVVIAAVATFQYFRIIKGANKLMEEVWGAADRAASEASLSDPEG